MTKDYKVEMKPSFWDVTLYHGAYSDAVEKHFYFRANDENEVWNFLCRYLEDIFGVDPDDYYDWSSAYKAIILDNRRGLHKNCPGQNACICGDAAKYPITKYAMVKWQLSKPEQDREVNWDVGYGDAWSVEISRLNVIEFQR